MKKAYLCEMLPTWCREWQSSVDLASHCESCPSVMSASSHSRLSGSARQTSICARSTHIPSLGNATLNVAVVMAINLHFNYGCFV